MGSCVTKSGVEDDDSSGGTGRQPALSAASGESPLASPFGVPLAGASLANGSDEDNDVLTEERDPLMLPAGYRAHSSHANQTVSFSGENENASFDQALNKTHRQGNRPRSPASILLKSSNLASNNDSSFSGGLQEWRQRRMSRTGIGEPTGSIHESSRASSSGSRSTPATRFLNITDDSAEDKFANTERQEAEGFSRIQNIVAKMNTAPARRTGCRIGNAKPAGNVSQTPLSQ